ncbi:MAG: FtsX-like permease family protein [Candidatus Eisenbacteria bacterium]|nr:FtsX-like permease family protein [Candidatus Eisenbacteria bacterium]
MRFADVYRLANANLWRTKLRTALTTLGVIIGIGALVSMVSFGVGIQKNVTDEITENELFTALQVTPADLDLEGIMSGDVSAMAERREDAASLDDDAVERMRDLPGVTLAFPEDRFPATLRVGERETRASVQVLPAGIGLHSPFDELSAGRFFETDVERSVILSPRVLREVGFRLDAPDRASGTRESGAGSDRRTVSADSLLGREVKLATSVIDGRRLALAAVEGELPVRQVETTLTIVGIRERPTGFGTASFASDVIVPSGTAAEIPRLDFTSAWDLLRPDGLDRGYVRVHVRAQSMQDVYSVRDEIRSMGFSVLALADQLEAFRRQFLILDTMLGAVGTIALFVASLGIVNTMVTSILERTREIGIMKAVGGSEGDIKRIFFVEAGTIGLVGGALGLALGWVVTRVANVVMNYHLRPEGLAAVDLFHMPAWLLLGALSFSVLVSLLAGVYPAARAARVEPVEALRHD